MVFSGSSIATAVIMWSLVSSLIRILANMMMALLPLLLFFIKDLAKNNYSQNEQENTNNYVSIVI